jgi:transposase
METNRWDAPAKVRKGCNLNIRPKRRNWKKQTLPIAAWHDHVRHWLFQKNQWYSRPSMWRFYFTINCRDIEKITETKLFTRYGR